MKHYFSLDTLTKVILITIPSMRQTKSASSNSKLAFKLSLGCAVIIVLLPFHAFFTTWAGVTFGAIDAFRIWKELLIGLLFVGLLLLMMRDKSLRQQFLGNFLVQLILVYAVYSLLRAVYGYISGNVNLEATTYGLISNLRYPVFFALVWAVCLRSNFLVETWQKLVLVPAMIVVGFGVLQQFLLPKNFLEHFGYGTNTIPAFQAVDQKPDYARLQSTLRGANPLGAYLILIATLLSARLMKGRNWRNLLLAVGTTTVLFFTYSRSAWLGLIISLLCLLLLMRPQAWRWVAVGSAALLVVTSTSIYLLRDNNWVQNVVFHSDETSQSATSSNEVRTTALTSNLDDVWSEPLGAGVGSAGPASTRNDKPARIAENYFIQIGQEVGIVGLLLYLGLTIGVAWGLWLRRQNFLAAVLLASLAGISAVNMISHAWADDTLSLLWWGLAGIAMATPVILKDKHHGQKTSPKTNPR